MVYERVHDNLKRLKLATMDELIDKSLEIAAREEQLTLEVLDYLLRQEVESKEARALEFRMRLTAYRDPRSIPGRDRRQESEQKSVTERRGLAVYRKRREDGT